MRHAKMLQAGVQRNQQNPVGQKLNVTIYFTLLLIVISYGKARILDLKKPKQ